MSPRYAPSDSTSTPRLTGPQTFTRLPHVEVTEGADVALIGVLIDDVANVGEFWRLAPRRRRSLPGTSCVVRQDR